jgi:dynein light chain LC8-type
MADKLDAPISSTDTGSGGAVVGGNGAGTPKAVIKNVDMSEEMQQETIDITSAALEKYNIEKDIAAQIKKEFDRRYGPTWHVVVGKNFGSYVTHGMYSVNSDHSSFLTRDTRNETLHLLLRRPTSNPHLEIIGWITRRGFRIRREDREEKHLVYIIRSSERRVYTSSSHRCIYPP